jgi:hypothetical protein
LLLDVFSQILVDFFKKFVGKFGGVKFEPSDEQLIDHLEAKINRFGDLKPNPLMNEFIATIEGEKGICYTLPDKLPGTPQTLATEISIECLYFFLSKNILSACCYI